MSRYILRYDGNGPSPSEDLDRVKADPDVEVVDTSPRMLLLESAPEKAEALARALPGWVLSPEHGVPLPRDPRPRLRAGLGGED